MSSKLRNAKNSEMAKRLAKTDPSEKAWARRNRADRWPYHSNLGTHHERPKNEINEKK